MGERAPGTHCLRMCLIAMEFMVNVFVHVCTYTGGVITHCIDVPVGVLFE